MKRNRFFLILLMLTLTLSACGGETAPAPTAEPVTQESAASGETTAPPETEATNTETAAVEETPEPTPEPTPEDPREDMGINELREEQNAWADSLFADALQKLVDRGDIPALSEDGMPAFVEREDPLAYDLEFLNPETEAALTGPFEMEPAEVIFAQNNVDFKRSAGGIEEIYDTVPWFFPTSVNGYTLTPEAFPEVFADHMEDCRYFIYNTYYETCREKGYYDLTNTDRVTKTTLVWILDAQNREVIHVENIGTFRAQGHSATAEEARGKVLWAEAEEYINGLLGA